MKPLKIRNYGSIPHLSSSRLGEGDHFIEPGQERILTEKRRDKHDTILVFEKYDGSNIGVARVGDDIFALTRSGYEAHTSPYKQHHLFSDWVKENKSMFMDILSDGERVVGEWLLQAHGTIYDIIGDPIVFFDYFDKGNNRLLYSDLNKTGLKTARLLHEGDPVKPFDLLGVLNEKDLQIKSRSNPEGMVYRVERKGSIDFLGKWVRFDFVPGKYCIGVNESDLIWNK